MLFSPQILVRRPPVLVAAASWTPASLTGLLAWYDATVGVLKTGGTAAANDDGVATWNDQSGNASNLVDAGTAQAVYKTAGLNGKPTIQFTNAAGNLLQKTSFPMGTGSTGSVFIVLSITASSANFSRVIDYIGAGDTGATGTNSAAFFIMHGAVTTVSGYQQGFLSDATIVNGTNYRLGSVFDGANHTIYLNNTGQTPAATSFTWNNNGHFNVGADDSVAVPADGNISEIIVMSGAASGTDRNNIDAYLQAKWGL